LAFSFILGLNLDMTCQNAMRRGREVKIPKNMLVLSPPPIFQDMYVGTKAMIENRAMLEKDIDPAASAGRGAFLMDGYYKNRSV